MKRRIDRKDVETFVKILRLGSFISLSDWCAFQYDLPGKAPELFHPGPLRRVAPTRCGDQMQRADVETRSGVCYLLANASFKCVSRVVWAAGDQQVFQAARALLFLFFLPFFSSFLLFFFFAHLNASSPITQCRGSLSRGFCDSRAYLLQPIGSPLPLAPSLAPSRSFLK
jgi:hypothetical protein